MKTFLISLKRATERRDRMIRDLQKISLDYEIFDAVDGKDLTDTDIAKYCDAAFLEKSKRWFPKGMIGCCLSHYFVYKKIVDENLDSAFIIEDDAKLTKNIPSIIENCEKEILHKNEVILVYYQTEEQMCRISNQNKTVLGGNFNLCYPYEAKHLSSTGAYIISKEACKKMIEYILPIKQAPDSWEVFFNNCLDSIRLVYPRPMETYDYRSTITNLSDIKQGNISKLVDFVDKNKIPVINQLLSLRRKYHKIYKDSKFEVINERSLILKD